MHNKITTLGALKKSKYVSMSIKEELRFNLINNIKAGKSSFTGIHGYETTVIPQLEKAILSQHNINLLGLRGQAKTRLARLMVNLLDEYIPAIKDSEINDDPLKPISLFGKSQVEIHGDKTQITWIHRSERFYEKLATPDVTISDLIGDIDPIKAANLKLSYADERVLHFGMIPRANRSIFVINELPDLQARIQVALFNILEEGDIQIRGFKLRMPIDVQFVFTANPEDYTNRGSIVTPLKDRIGSQILTHYPETIQIAKTITSQEAALDTRQSSTIFIPELAKDILEQIVFEARKSEFVDVKSGVSARLSITAFENLVSTAERRLLHSGDDKTGIRMSDFTGIIPAITGKIELVYEGEQEGAYNVALTLLGNAIKSLYSEFFPKIEKIEKQGVESPYDEIVSWFFNHSEDFEILDDISEKDYRSILEKVKPLSEFVLKYQLGVTPEEVCFWQEFVLWSLVEHKKLSKYRYAEGVQFKDPYGSFISGL